jgi:hypothetical protein
MDFFHPRYEHVTWKACSPRNGGVALHFDFLPVLARRRILLLAFERLGPVLPWPSPNRSSDPALAMLQDTVWEILHRFGEMFHPEDALRYSNRIHEAAGVSLNGHVRQDGGNSGVVWGCH